MCRADVEERLSAGDRTDAIKDEDGKPGLLQFEAR